MIKYSIGILTIFLAIAFYSCSDDITGQRSENLSPNTNLSIYPDSIIAPGSTIKTIRWWGDDPDGYVKGYMISFDSVNWGFTNGNDSSFVLHINGNDSTFRFFVAAVDDKGLVDPTPASNLYPVVNSAPSVIFDVGTEIPDTTFPLASFKWTGTDPDGNENIRYYQYSLNDTNNFRRISASMNLLTLTQDSGLVLNSNNILYLRAEDDAGALSKIVRMPDTSKYWYVKPVTAKVLLIKDMPLGQFGVANSFFDAAFDTVKYDVLDIKSNNGALIPKIVNPMFIETLKLFDIVVWSANQGTLTSDNANFDLAQNSLPFYLLSGKKLFFTTGFPNSENTVQGSLINFAPIDSITSCSLPFVSGGTNLINTETSYPVVSATSGGIFLQRIRGIKSSDPTVIVYRLPLSTTCQTNMVVAIKDRTTNPKNIFMSMPVYYTNGDAAASKTLFNKILVEEFGHR